MKKDTARNYAIHAISKIVDFIDKEYQYSKGMLNGLQMFEDANPDTVKKYMYRSELCSYFSRFIKMEILDEFEEKQRGEYNLYD